MVSTILLFYVRDFNWSLVPTHTSYDGAQHHIGLFMDEAAAARAYDVVARRHHKHRAQLNLPVSDDDVSDDDEDEEEEDGDTDDDEDDSSSGEDEEEDSSSCEEEEEEEGAGRSGSDEERAILSCRNCRQNPCRQQPACIKLARPKQSRSGSHGGSPRASHQPTRHVNCGTCAACKRPVGDFLLRALFDMT